MMMMIDFLFGKVEEDDHDRDEEKILANHSSLLHVVRSTSSSRNATRFAVMGGRTRCDARHARERRSRSAKLADHGTPLYS
jgi:hypothetical protein